MKEIRAFIQPHKLNSVTIALQEIPGFPGMTVIDTLGFGREGIENAQDFRPFLTKKRLEVFSPDRLAEEIFETIMKIAHSGQHGDGKVYINDVISGARISTCDKSTDLD